MPYLLPWPSQILCIAHLKAQQLFPKSTPRVCQHSTDTQLTNNEFVTTTKNNQIPPPQSCPHMLSTSSPPIQSPAPSPLLHRMDLHRTALLLLRLPVSCQPFPFCTAELGPLPSLLLEYTFLLASGKILSDFLLSPNHSSVPSGVPSSAGLTRQLTGTAN